MCYVPSRPRRQPHNRVQAEPRWAKDAWRDRIRSLRALPEALGKALVLNVSGAIPAVLLDAGYPIEGLKGVPILARTASLVAHLVEEQMRPIGFALAAGRMESRDISPRVRVWAEPEVVESAAWEFGETEQFLKAAESLTCPYPWGRYDVLCLPPSFPYGGMENPCLTA